MSPGELVVLALLGGVLTLDGTSVGQFMLSRPLVAATLSGWVLGDPAAGFEIGVLLELYHLVVVPVGGARFPETAPAAVVGAATAFLAHGAFDGATGSPAAGLGAGAIAFGVLLALLWGTIGGVSVTALRRLNARLACDPERGRITGARIVGVHLAGIGLDFGRGCGLVLTGVAVAVLGVETAALWPLERSATLGILLVGASVPLGMLLRSLGGRRRMALFATGVLAGVLGVVFL